MENDVLTSEMKGHRTLATVVFTDCVGFSARMSVDEDHTLSLIRRDLKLMKRLCEDYEGRVLKSTGDGLLMCFISAVKAVECSVEIQRQITTASAALPANDSLRHRIGIHLADIFISETDVMGNGVNIAARLQTLADPGGICISQTVYDVIKAGLRLETRYLGPQELKNIREVVATYKILLEPEPETTDPYLNAALQLEENSNLLRIKKLLLYACRNVWENDSAKINAADTRALLQELLRLAPTRDRLQPVLDSVVRTLSKPAEYSLIASIIADEINPVYAILQPQSPPDRSLNQDSWAEATVAFAQASSSAGNSLYEQIAQELAQAGNIERVKKLIFYVSKRRWENDLHQLNGVPLADLIADLYQKAPTVARLQALLQEFVQTLSKQVEYSLVANLIVSKLQRLYPPIEAPAQEDATCFTVSDDELAAVAANHLPYTAIATVLNQDPNLPRIKKMMLYLCRRQWANNQAQLASVDTEVLVRELHQLAQTQAQLELSLNAVVRSLNKRDEYAAIAQTIITQFRRLYGEQDTPPTALDQAVPAPSNLVGAEPVPPVSAPLIPHTPPPIPSASEGKSNVAVAPQVELSSHPEQPKKQEQDQVLSFFDYRLAVMKYANPLRAKILLFAALHQGFTYAEQDWFNLKLCELDGLMRRLLSTCRVYTDMEALLYEAARGLQDPEEYVQTATAVIKCIRPFYIHGGPVLAIPQSNDLTRIKLDDFEETTLEIASANDEEFTCQLLANESEMTRVEAPANLPTNASPVKSSDDSNHHLQHDSMSTQIEVPSPLPGVGQPETLNRQKIARPASQLQPSTNQDATG